MINLYMPGNSLMHRAPAGLKVVVLAAIALILTLLKPSWTVVAISLGIPALAYLAAGLGPRVVWRDIRGLILLVIFLAVTQMIFSTPMAAISNSARVIGVVLLAQVITRTTRVEAMIELMERLLGPLRRFRVKPERIGLVMALAITSIGQLTQLVHQVREAQRSRGVKLAPWAWIMPVLVLTLRHADDVGDALLARGAAE